MTTRRTTRGRIGFDQTQQAEVADEYTCGPLVGQ